jgi:2-methylcitrate dehydratase PrpD
MAVSFAGGVRGNFGSMTKSLHVGRIAQSAILAVELAQQGFTASCEAIEGAFGYWTVFGRDARFADETIGSWLGNPFEIVTPGFNIKAYPCCASAHAAIDAALTVRDGMSLDEIKHVVVEVPYTAPLLLIHHEPAEPLAAKFSLEFCVAAALLDGAVTLEHFSDAAVLRTDVQALLRQVTYEIPPEWQHDDGIAKTGFARITVHLADGSVQHAEVSEVRGSPGRPLSDQELDAKFASCASLVFADRQVQELLGALRHVEGLGSIRQLSALLTAQPAPDRGC